MDLRPLAPDLSVAPQIEPADLPALAAAGYVAVIDNRPDGEVEPPLGSGAMAEAAAQAGLAFHYLPIEPGQLTPALVRQFAAAIDGAGGPVLAYCRSGTRSSMAWAASQIGRRPTAEILGAAAAAGYDLGGMIR